MNYVQLVLILSCLVAKVKLEHTSIEIDKTVSTVPAALPSLFSTKRAKSIVQGALNPSRGTKI